MHHIVHSLVVVLHAMYPDMLGQKVTAGDVVRTMGTAEWQSFGFVELAMVHELRTTPAFIRT